MPTYTFTAPDGKEYEFDYPVALHGDDLARATDDAYGLLLERQEEREGKQAFLPNVKAGFTQAVGSGIYGASDLVGFGAGKEYGQKMLEDIPEYANVPTFQETKDAYGDGLGAGVDETWDMVKGNTGQVSGGLPAYLTSVKASGLAGGAMGAPFGPVGVRVGTLTGEIVGPALTYFYGQNRMRQEEEIKRAEAAGEEIPEYSTAETLAYSVAQSATERFGIGVLGKYFPFLNKFVSKIGATKDAGKSLLGRTGKGMAAGVGVEVPVEFIQSVLERQAAGLPLDDESALTEYEEVMAATVAGVAPLGGVGGALRRNTPTPETEPGETDEGEGGITALVQQDIVGPAPQGGLQLGLPEVGIAQIDPNASTITEVEEEPTIRRPLPGQGAFDFDTVDPRSALAQEQARVAQEKARARSEEIARANEEFERRSPEDKLAAIEDELATFEQIYPKGNYTKRSLEAVKTDLNARRKKYRAELKQKQAAEKDAKVEDIKYIRERAPLTGVIDKQMAIALGVNPQATRTLKRILGQDLDTLEGRATVLEALEDYGDAKLETNPLVTRLEEAVKADVPGITNFSLEPQKVGEQIEPDQAQAIADFSDMYRRALDLQDKARQAQIDAAARDVIDPKEWGRAKSAMTRDKTKQAKELASGARPDMIADVDRAQRAKDLAIEAQQLAEKYRNARGNITPDDAFKLSTLAQALSQANPVEGAQVEPTIQTTERAPARDTAVDGGQQQSRAVEPETATAGVDVAGVTESEPEPAKRTKTLKLPRVGKNKEAAATADNRAPEVDTTLEQPAKPKAEVDEDADLVEDVRYRLKKGIENNRATIESAAEEDKQYLTGLVDQLEQFTANKEGVRPTEAEMNALAAVTGEVNKSTNKVRLAKAEATQSNKDKTEQEQRDAADTRVVERKTKTVTAQEKRNAKKAPATGEDTVTPVTPSEVEELKSTVPMDKMPQTVLGFQKIAATGFRDNNAIIETASQAQVEGFITENERQSISRLLSKLENTSAGNKLKIRHGIVDNIVDRVTAHAYFNNNPEMAKSVHDHIQQAVADYEAGADKVREAFSVLDPDSDSYVGYTFSRAGTPESPKSTVTEIKNEGKQIFGRLKKVIDVEVVQHATDLPIESPSDVRGMYHHGKVWIVADNVSALELRRVLAHEAVGHAGLETILGKGAFTALLNQIHGMKTTNPRIKAELENIKRAYTNAQGDYNLDAMQENREILAHIAEGLPEFISDSKAARIWNNIKTKVSQWLAKIGLGDIADADLNRLIYLAAETVQGNKHAITGKEFVSTDYQSLDVMRRAWNRGYRGTDLSDAARWNREVVAGAREVPKQTVQDVQNAPMNMTEGLDYDLPAYSRPAKVPTKWAKYADPQPETKGAFHTMRSLSAFQNKANEFMVKMVDSAYTVEDKIMKLYNNDIDGVVDGLINPMPTYSQSTRRDGITNSFYRTGEIMLQENGIFNTKRQGRYKKATMYEISGLVADIAKTATDKGAAEGIVSKAFIARREEDLVTKHNVKINQQIKELTEAGKLDKARELAENSLYNPKYTDAERAEYLALFNEWPQLNKIADKWSSIRKSVVDLMLETGVIHKNQHKEWLDNLAYVPFNRIMESAEHGGYVGGYTRTSQGLTSIPSPKALTMNSSREINDVVDNMARMVNWGISSAVNNYASKQLIMGLQRVEGAVLGELKHPKQATNRAAVVSYIDGGRKNTKYFELRDPHDAYAFNGLETVASESLTILSKFSDMLRKGVTLSPEFIISQIEQDIGRAFTFSGVKNPLKLPKMMMKALYDIRGDLGNKGLGDEFLSGFGITGMYDTSTVHAKEQMESAYHNIEHGWFGKLIKFGEHNAEASDLALRKAIAEQTLAEGGSERLAIWRASEIINFNRRGSSKLAATLRQIIPFQNAYMQGMQILGKAMSGRGLSQQDRANALRYFWYNGAKIATLTALYAMLMGDDDEYMAQPDYVRSRYFLIPTGDNTPPLKFAMAPDIGFLFKAIPELMVRKVAHENIDNRAFMSELQNAATNAILGPSLVPQLFKPTVEVKTNHSFMMDSPIIGLDEKDKALRDQYRASTSELSKALGQTGLISPIILDHYIRGTFGSLGGTLLSITDEIALGVFNAKRPDTELEKLPIMRALFSAKYGQGTRSDFYDMRDRTRGVMLSLKQAAEEQDPDKMERIVQDRGAEISLNDALSPISNFMADANEAIRVISSDPKMPPAKRRREIDRIKKEIAKVNGAIRALREEAYGK